MFRVKEFWWKLNSIFPNRLRVMTVNSLSQCQFKLERLSWEDIVKDPLQVLKCNENVFLCPELMEIVLHILQSFLIASRTYFAHHLLEMPSKSMDEEKDREELRIALIQTQESCAIQILLEACAEKPEVADDPKLSARLREVQKLICSHLHQVFISDPTLAKLIHFQGYDSGLLNLVVSKIPSMHICLDFIPELLNQPDLDKQVRDNSEPFDSKVLNFSSNRFDFFLSHPPTDLLHPAVLLPVQTVLDHEIAEHRQALFQRL